MTTGDATGFPAGEQLVLGVSWAHRTPQLDLTSVDSGADARLPLLHRRLGWRVTRAGRFCTGWYGFVAGVGQRLPCPDQAIATMSGQCLDCAVRDQFRFAHQGHLGGYVPTALEPYLAQPHWLYLATFADGFTKVGTAAEHRKQSRLDEQGPARATYIAYAENGRLVREAEDLVSRELDVAQHRRRAAKVAAYVTPAPPTYVASRHREAVSQATALVTGTVWPGQVRPIADEWQPPAAQGELHESAPMGGRVAYPLEVSTGEHGLLVDACAGPAALARTQPGPDVIRYVVDLGKLSGTRLVLGDFASPETEVQESLF
ncbi:MAG: hypothetical protein ABWX96_06910 [Propionibacteriaceae bacterium]